MDRKGIVTSAGLRLVSTPSGKECLSEVLKLRGTKWLPWAHFLSRPVQARILIYRTAKRHGSQVAEKLPGQGVIIEVITPGSF